LLPKEESAFFQLAKNIFPTWKKYLPNWGNIFSVHKKKCCCAQAQIFLCAGASHSFAVTNVPLCRNLAGSET
jgi:hypothetical protein